MPPILAVEVAGEDDDKEDLRAKAAWYLAHGVEVVWLVFPDTRSATVVTAEGERSLDKHDHLPAHPSLPGLDVEVSRFFRQLDG